MPNMHDCLDRAVAGGELDKGRAAAAKARFDELVQRYRTQMPEHEAQAAAAQDLRAASKAATAAKAHKTIAQLQAMRRIRHQVETAKDPAVAIRQLLEHSEGSGFKGESVRSLTEAYIRSINAGIGDFLRETGLTMTGASRDTARLENVVRELHLEATGDARAAELADAVRGQYERMRQQFNAHGGDIGKLDDFGVHHTHEVTKVRAAGFDAWARDIEALLDWSRITDKSTGQPFAARKGEVPHRSATDRFLREVYDGITTGGWHAREPSLSVGGKALYARRAEPRQLHFKSGSDWMTYNARYGAADPFSSLVGGLHGMARDVAMMRVLGPNPKMGLEFAVQVAEKKAATAKDAKLEARVNSQAGLARTMMAHLDGSANMPRNHAWAAFFGGTRQVLTSIQLGSAILSSPTDLATIAAAAHTVGMHPKNVLSRHVQLMASHATRETAARMGYVADTLADAGAAAARFMGQTWAPEVANRLSGFVMRASGLSYWTDMARTAFQMEFAGFLAENAGRAWGDIDAPLRQVLEARGITAADWDMLRNPDALFTAPNGSTFLSPFHWLEHQTELPREAAEGLAMRLQMAIEEQMEFAVPTATVEGRARLQGSAPPGTFAGEFARSTMMYKSFALSLTLNQYRRIMALPTPMRRAAYAASLGAGLMLLGALSVQNKEVGKGRDPRPMTDGKFWMAALFQGGGLGIFGDFFASETSRSGGGLAETLAGPVVGFASSVLKPVASNIQRAVKGEDVLIGRDAANFVRYNTPVASSLWYARLAFDRLVADQLQAFLDPEASKLWKQQQSRMIREFGTRQWWRSGTAAPQRGPDLSNAVRQE